MIRVLLIANDSIFADVIMSTLAQQTDLDVQRTTFHETRTYESGLHSNCSVVVVIEDGQTEEAPTMPIDLDCGSDRVRVLKVSPEHPYVQVRESYQIPVTRLAQMVDLVREPLDHGRKDKGEHEW